MFLKASVDPIEAAGIKPLDVSRPPETRCQSALSSGPFPLGPLEKNTRCERIPNMMGATYKWGGSASLLHSAEPSQVAMTLPSGHRSDSL